MEPLSDEEIEAETRKCSCCRDEHCTGVINLLHKIVDGVLAYTQKKKNNTTLDETLNKEEPVEVREPTEVDESHEVNESHEDHKPIDDLK